ncbi:hypothetical protein LCGC14_1964100 [marine sediment metagenome]|uniref:Uncharacterized protein n=1 Tax=marine sediment metagenome TaxID=412755 RepID=A0A0F9IAR4_9ZZZZ
MEQIASSTDRLAWQSTREQGMGSGLTVHMDRQPAASSGRPLIRGYYKSKKYQDILRVE